MELNLDNLEKMRQIDPEGIECTFDHLIELFGTNIWYWDCCWDGATLTEDKIIVVDNDIFNLDVVIKNKILAALEFSDWIQKDAAELLGISPRVLNYKIGYYKIQHESWRKNNSKIKR